MCSYFTCFADTPEQKHAAHQRLLYYLTNFIPAVPQDPDRAPPHIRYFVDIAERVKRSIITSTVEEVVRQFEQVELAGIEEVICYFNFGFLAREVMPHFAAAREPYRSASLSREVFHSVRRLSARSPLARSDGPKGRDKARKDPGPLFRRRTGTSFCFSFKRSSTPVTRL